MKTFIEKLLQESLAKKLLGERFVKRWQYIHRAGYWSKGYRQVLIIFAIVGSTVLVWYLQGSPQFEIVQAVLLFLATIAAVGSARESFDVKQVQQKDLKETRLSRKNEHLPIIVPCDKGAGAIEGNGTLKMVFTNVGKGIARDILIIVGNDLMKAAAFQNMKNLQVGSTLSLSADSTTQERIRNNINNNPSDFLKVIVKYQDIVGRDILTSCKLPKNSDGNYSLEQADWSFSVEENGFEDYITVQPYIRELFPDEY